MVANLSKMGLFLFFHTSHETSRNKESKAFLKSFGKKEYSVKQLRASQQINSKSILLFRQPIMSEKSGIQTHTMFHSVVSYRLYLMHTIAKKEMLKRLEPTILIFHL